LCLCFVIVELRFWFESFCSSEYYTNFYACFEGPPS
jgi:hypothetical protein